MESLDNIFRLSARKLAVMGEALGIRHLDKESGKIFISGGTGVIGHRVAQRLVSSGYPDVRLGAHDVDTLHDLKDKGAEVVKFAWDDESTYSSALKGVKSVLCTIPYLEGWSEHFPAFLRACSQAGVRHIVKMSFYHANIPNDPFQAVPLVREHGKCDEQLIHMVKPPVEISAPMSADTDVAIEFHRTRMSYTILYASHLMSNPFTLQGTQLRENFLPSAYSGSSANRRINYVSPNDVAEVAMRCLLEPSAHYDKEYTLTGPEAITEQEVANLLSKYLQKPIMYVDKPLRLFTEEIESMGDPKWMVDDLAALEVMKASGAEEDPSFVSPDIEKICGHAPESFAEYLGHTEMMVPVEAVHADATDLAPMKRTISA